MTMKETGRRAAEDLTNKTGRLVDFMEFDGKRFHFMITRYKLLKIIGLDGKIVRESSISDNRFASNSYPVYAEMACYPEQLENGDAQFFVENGLTQEEHGRFGKWIGFEND